ncbi:MAG: hypothetical protein H6811_04950 [Phycisphaeraceae bacterium]|nr:hypothetical protein [Phycisphaeraceae bacterium]
MRTPPKYRQRQGLALVTLTDAPTGRRRDYRLGEFGSPESKERYFRVLAAWESRGRRFPESDADATRTLDPPEGEQRARSVNALIAEYWIFAKAQYSRSAALGIRMALRVLRECYGTTDAGAFGPRALSVVRDAMILGREGGERARAPWCRQTVNTRISQIVGVFRWAASREMLPPGVYQSLQTL